MSYFSNKNWKRVYKVTFNDADIFSHKVYRRGSDDNFILDTIELDDDTAGHVFKVAKKIATAMNKTLDMDGLNVVQNNGEAAGQTVFHFHMHIIPRHKDDTVNVGWEKHKVSSERIKDITDEVRKYL